MKLESNLTFNSIAVVLSLAICHHNHKTMVISWDRRGTQQRRTRGFFFVFFFFFCFVCLVEGLFDCLLRWKKKRVARWLEGGGASGRTDGKGIAVPDFWACPSLFFFFLRCLKVVSAHVTRLLLLPPSLPLEIRRRRESSSTVDRRHQ